MSWSQDASLTDERLVMQVNSASTVLAPLCDGLCSLNARVAKKFLSLASVLQSNSARARQITVESHKATGSGDNSKTSQSVEVLQRIVSESAGISKMVGSSTEQMLAILSRVDATRVPLQNLARMQSLLQTVGLLSRIEGGRNANTSVDLSSFASDIDTLAKEVEQHVDRMACDSSKLSETLKNGVRELLRFEQEERVQSADLIRRTQAVLEPIVARSAALRTAARDIEEQYADFHRATDKVVISLQSEDIARQRVEHVQEALRGAAAAIDSGERGESCAGVLALQRAQLVSTRDMLAKSIRTIHCGLESLGPRIQELVSRTATLAHDTDEDGQSFAAVIESGLETVSTVFDQCSSSVKAVIAIVSSIVPSVEQMTQGARALEEIESSVHLNSVNAKIKAAQLSTDGVAMGTIASELSTINRESEGNTRIVLDSLAAINEGLAKITLEETMAAASWMMTRGSQAVSIELADLSNSVKASSQEMTLGLNQVRELAKVLCSDLARGCELSHSASLVTELFDEQLREFDGAFERLGYTKAMVAACVDSSQAGNLSKLYSMESERKLHEEAFRGESGATENRDNSDCGDDVELF
jgi:hypothetical protein